MGVFAEFVANIGLAAVKDKLNDAIAEKCARDRLLSYLTQQNSLNFSVSLEEEIDFGGLAEYITEELIDDVKKRFWGNRKERGQARERILQKACSYASANTSLSRERTIKIVGTSVDVLRKFYRNKTNRDLRFLAGEIEDSIISQSEETRALVSKESRSIQKLIQDNNKLSVDCATNMIDGGKVKQVEENVGSFLNAISSKHELFPYYGFRMTTENRMVSIPLTDEARKRFPESYKITASTARLGNQTLHSLNKSVFDQAYRHQLPIIIDVQNAKKYLGNVLDPIQSEAEEMIGQQAIVKPPEFPKAFPCNVMVESDIVVPFLLLRTKKILEDGSVIITNEEQENYHFNVRITCFFNRKKVTFTVTPQNASNKELLHYRLFLKRILAGEQVTVNALTLNEKLMCGTVDQKEIENLDNEIDFLTKIVQIEEYFDTSIVIPEEIEKEDHFLINRIISLIQGEYIGSWDKFDFSFVLTEEVRERICELEDVTYGLAYSAEATFSVFDTELKLPIIREIECARVENLVRAKEKVSILDIGDEIKIVYVPGNSQPKGKYVDRIETSGVEAGMLFSRASSEIDSNS